ncbi:hypothetical protein ACTMUQ_07685 [Streptomyces sp. SD11]|uniref:hypothetical protein n=1 Tax=unclassified Streptomyces TaxID=2593676 RepID=UPI00200CA800|nr:hypothetical protein [Streptomyces sp. LRE541]UPZ26927.1 hypothetical protein MUK60_03360 [Streptomyces sp. LRE541]
MPEEPTPGGPLGTAMRKVTFPDGSRGIILVKAGTSQEDADLRAAQVWAERSERGRADS